MVGHAQAVVWLPTLPFALSPTAPEPARASAPGHHTLSRITGAELRQAQLPSWLHNFYVGCGTLGNNESALLSSSENVGSNCPQGCGKDEVR